MICRMADFDADDLVFRADTLSSGRTDGDLRRDVRDGVAQRIWRGVYLPARDGVHGYEAQLEKYRATIRAAALSGGNMRVISHASALAVQRIPMLRPDLSKVHFTAEGSGKTTKRAVIHQATLDGDVIEVDGLSVTTLPRSTCDHARMGTLEQAVCVLDAGMHAGVTEDQLAQQMARMRRGHRIAILRAAIPLADGLAESVGESLSRLVMVRHPLIPAPDLQVQITIDVGGQRRQVRADFGWRDQEGVLRLIGEFDGRFKYHRANPFGRDRLPEDVIYAEKLREDAIRDTGPHVVRWTWSDTQRPKVLHAKLIGALEVAGLIR